MYSRGEGVPQDDAEAVKWYRLSADQGFAPAQNDLGTMYASGRGVPKDASDAAKWFQLAADRGFVPAQYNLAVMYETGHGMPQDDVQALKWLSLAVSRASIADRDKVLMRGNALAAKMTPEQIAEAERLAREWRPK
ncbi:sel1 repeat family protein [Mesorhizobium sp. M0293]|uniref:tetratricopeptide repeat protein n=1 Tax=Mesorhizobium sp. M0293 TaxID=2956930 RepID=UPI003337F9F8